MPRRRGDGPGHARARHKAQEAAVRGLVADAVAEAHEAHAAARRDLTGSARAFLNETAFPAVCALNRAGAPTLLPAMHRIVNTVRPGLISPEAALYGHWMEWHESNRSGRPLSMGDTLQLTGAGSASSSAAARVGKDGVYIRVTYIYAYRIARIQYSTRLLGGPPTGARRACRRRE